MSRSTRVVYGLHCTPILRQGAFLTGAPNYIVTSFPLIVRAQKYSFRTSDIVLILKSGSKLVSFSWFSFLREINEKFFPKQPQTERECHLNLAPLFINQHLE